MNSMLDLLKMQADEAHNAFIAASNIAERWAAKARVALEALAIRERAAYDLFERANFASAEERQAFIEANPWLRPQEHDVVTE